ncbi:hypothetical protein SLEP1_g1283 [Rubroshorea leprosula]|uniref:Pentatricopeptide repeat-containing protein n=1 Tax=Rubroshorea leprosula TaxID=152421 RepID=A0AAV5HM30_9ROSI|nr:hypothetical protein SLEP1_g1283 [Rubroshorea leprosula]
MRERDVVSWIVLITGYNCAKKYDGALITYEQMQYAGKKRWELDMSLSVFCNLKGKNVYAWNTVINGLALAKSREEAVWWFNRMEQEGFKPVEDVTFVEPGAFACSHSVLVDTGHKYYFHFLNESMDFCLVQNIIHVLSISWHLQEMLIMLLD